MAKVVITMPAYRAESTLERTIADIPEHIADHVILVDDASPDNTASLAQQLGIRVYVHRRNRGYGGNQKTCYVAALREGADIVVMLHPDHQYDPGAVPSLIAPILAGDADMSFGSRFAGLGDPIGGGMPTYRFLGNRITTTLENLMLGSRFTEMHSGMRAYSRRCLLSLPFLRYSDGFVFDTQFLVDAISSGLRVVEVPIPARYTKESSSISGVALLNYVSQSLIHSTGVRLARGRRGRRNATTLRKLRRGPSLGRGRPIEHPCVLCGNRVQELIYPANALGPVTLDEFACTTEALGRHDDILQCRRCGLVCSRPTLQPDEILDLYARTDDRLYLTEEPSRRALFGWIARRMRGYSTGGGRRLLEVGSNVGLFLRVAEEHGWDARGIEPSKWAVDLGREQFHVNLSRGTIEELDEPQESADAVVMLDVLEHLVDPLEALRRVRPILAEEGILILSTVNLSGLHARLRKSTWPWFIRSHLFYFSPETLHAMLGRAGFRMVEWATAPRSFHLSYLAHRTGPSHGLVGATLKAVSKIADPQLPVGWLGDITLVAARPQ